MVLIGADWCSGMAEGLSTSPFPRAYMPTPARPALQTSLSPDNNTFTVGAGNSNVMTMTALYDAAGPGVGITTGVGSFVGTAGFNLVRAWASAGCTSSEPVWIGGKAE